MHSLKTSLRCFIVREFIHVGFVAPRRIVGFFKNGIHRGRHEFEVGTIQGSHSYRSLRGKRQTFSLISLFIPAFASNESKSNEKGCWEFCHGHFPRLGETP